MYKVDPSVEALGLLIDFDYGEEFELVEYEGDDIEFEAEVVVGEVEIGDEAGADEAVACATEVTSQDDVAQYKNTRTVCAFS